MKEAKKAIALWLKSHSCAYGWKPINGMIQKNGLPVVILHNPYVNESYSVQYAGNGHYFKTLDAAEAYIRAHKWQWGI